MGMDAFVIHVDTREQKPWEFDGVTVSRGGRQVAVDVQTLTCKLDTGDYSIVGLEDKVAIERKSLADLYGTLVRGRKRFLRELDRMDELEYSAVVVEGEWEDLMRYVKEKTQASPASIDSSIIALDQRHKASWIFRPSRRVAMKTAYKILERFYKDAR